MSEIVFVSDFFLNECLGGAEKCNDALIGYLSEHHSIEKVKSANITTEFLSKRKDKFFIVANFFLLPPEARKYLSNNIEYIIYEHDHKYLSTNNPLLYKNFLAPENHIINKEFYKSAKNVICQSKLHASVIHRNLMLDNIINAGANFWSREDLNFLESCIDTKKVVEYACMDTPNRNKGTHKALDFCNKNNFKLTPIPPMSYTNFIKRLASVQKFIFFPQWIESYSRVAIEARILGCKLLTNKLLGVASEEYFKLTGRDLLQKIKENNLTLLTKINRLIEGRKVVSNFSPQEIPKITISCSVYDGDKYIAHFLEDIVKQTIFDKCELIIVNANSPGEEEKIILEYCEKYDNIKYHRLDYRATTTEVVNMVIDELSTGEFITIGNIDDRRKHTCLETQAKHLLYNKNIDLVYGDCLQTKGINETFDYNTSDGTLYEHSKNQFSRENMIKCLPGPMPMWRSQIHQEIGLFSHNYNYANDWDMWLRMVDAGRKFMKIDETLGLYLFNDEGRSTSKKHFKKKIKEESKLFFSYKHIFGEKNFNLFKEYFSQGA
jgi:hypothetical protein